jgi:hypothetical protein
VKRPGAKDFWKWLDEGLGEGYLMVVVAVTISATLFVIEWAADGPPGGSVLVAVVLLIVGIPALSFVLTFGLMALALGVIVGLMPAALVYDEVAKLRRRKRGSEIPPPADRSTLNP